MNGKRKYGVLKEGYFIAVEDFLGDIDQSLKREKNLLLEIKMHVANHVFMGDLSVHEEWVEIFEMSDPPTQAEIELMDMMGYRFKRGE